jgi:hypothetical protein
MKNYGQTHLTYFKEISIIITTNGSLEKAVLTNTGQYQTNTQFNPISYEKTPNYHNTRTRLGQLTIGLSPSIPSGNPFITGDFKHHKSIIRFSKAIWQHPSHLPQ